MPVQKQTQDKRRDQQPCAVNKGKTTLEDGSKGNQQAPTAAEEVGSPGQVLTRYADPEPDEGARAQTRKASEAPEVHIMSQFPRPTDARIEGAPNSENQ